MFSGRVNAAISKKFEVGFSVATNQYGNEILEGDVVNDNTGNATVFAPDFGLYLPAGKKAKLEVEGGFAKGSISKDVTGAPEDEKFTALDVSARWKKKLDAANENLGGLNGFELALGFSSVKEEVVNEETTTQFRVGPAVNFGKQARLQINFEQTSPEVGDSFKVVRSQATFNF